VFFDVTSNLIVMALWVIFGLVKVWAFIDCLRRRPDAFPAIGRASKVLWLILTGVSMLTGFLPGLTLSIFEVRPKIIAITQKRY
jgi:hypothetical protein